MAEKTTQYGLLSDLETKVDLLNNEPVAKMIVEIIRQHRTRPVTIGVHGDWGAGKSSVLEMVESGLTDDDKSLCLKFNGWRFQGFEDAKIALIEGIVTDLVERRGLASKASDLVSRVFRRINWMKVSKVGATVGTSVGAAAFMQNPALLFPALVALAQASIKSDAAGTVEKLSALVKEAPAQNVVNEIKEFRKDFKELMEKAQVDQLVVLVDDLDRCLPETAIQTLEAIRLLILTEGTAFVIAADETMIEAAVRRHFSDTAADQKTQAALAKSYLEKLIQIPVRIPALGETETRLYVTLLLIESAVGSSDPLFKKVAEAARERLRKPWAAHSFTSEELKSLVTNEYQRIAPAIVLSEQMGRALALGTRGNPRQIKRFINSLKVRQTAAQARGFGDLIQVPVLAKLMLAERFHSDAFERIASDAGESENGLCAELTAFEAVLAGKASDAKLPEDWTESDGMSRWARLAPQLGTVDLRPYLFAIKERKDYQSSATASGSVSALREMLMAAEVIVRANAARIRGLRTDQALQLFTETREQIRSSSSDFKVRPAGVDGLCQLAVEHPSLESNLLDFVESLPHRKGLGLWATVGWNRAVKSTAGLKRLDEIVATWETEGDGALKTAASLQRKSGKKNPKT